MSNDLDTAPLREFVAKKRDCLKCRQTFESSWAGERVCRRCKSNDSWRNTGLLPSEYPVVRRN
jgi:hypothetical protein